MRIGHNVVVRRSLAGSVFALATVLTCLAVAGVSMQRTMLSSTAAGKAVGAALGHEELRSTYTGLLAETAAPLLYPDDPNGRVRVLSTIDQVLAVDAGRDLAAPTFVAIHERVRGTASGPVAITPAELVQIVRDEHAAVAPTIAFTVDEVGIYGLVDSALAVAVPVAAIGALLLWMFVLAMRPPRSSVLRGAGVLLLAVAVSIAVFRWLVPITVASTFGDDVWSSVPGAAASSRRTGTLAAAMILGVVGAALLRTGTRMIPTRRWSSPISMHRDGFERRWS